MRTSSGVGSDQAAAKRSVESSGAPGEPAAPVSASLRLLRMIDRFLPRAASLPPASLRRLRLGVGASLLLFWSGALPVAGLYVTTGMSLYTTLAIATAVLMGANLLLVRRFSSSKLPGTVVCLWMFAAFSLLSWYEADIYSSHRYVLLPLCAAFLVGARAALVFTGLSLLDILASAAHVYADMPVERLWYYVESMLETVMAGGLAILYELSRSRAETSLALRAEELQRSNRELEQFAYVASHDLQEPLRMVSGFTQLLVRRYRGKLGSEADEFVGFVVDGVVRMQRLIDDLLVYSRVGTQGRAFASTNLNQVFDRLLRDLSPAIRESGAQVTVDPLPAVQGDELQLGQLFQNLIANAIKFQAPGTVATVHVSCRTEEDEHVISVRDNGIGIDPQYFERIFVIFQRLHGKGEYPGTGIGLAICKKIAERHRGRIWVDSAPGQGSTFRVSLPAEPRTPGHG